MSEPRVVVLLLAMSLASACTAEECVDTDLDGYGPGCAEGLDCDPNNPVRNRNCETVPPPDCSVSSISPGCPCLFGSVANCFEEYEGLGMCVTGRARCVAGYWGICVGGVGPRNERCNATDDDCDGLIDETVLSPCGGCTPGCLGGVWGDGPTPFVPNDDLVLTSRGELALATVETTFSNLWVPNTADGTISRIDTATATETARYSTGGTEPARVAVDYLGDAWVINREFDGVSTVTKIAGEARRCVDRDLDGLETSTGPADVRPIDEDECVLLHAEVGEALSVARALAIDGDTGLDSAFGGDAWIGLHDAQAVVEVSGQTGETLRRIETPGFSPYSATFDRWGILNMISRDGYLVRIDPREDDQTFELITVPLACYLLYAVASDPEGRLLLTGFSCDRVASYDPAVQRFESRATEASPRGAAPDGQGGFFIAHTGGAVSAVHFDPLRVDEPFPLGDGAFSPFESIGVAVDGFSNVWAVSSQGGAGGLGIATRIDPENGGRITAQVTVGRAPHVQGDLTGRRVALRSVPFGSITQIFDGCGPTEETMWRQIHLTADPGPAGVIEIEARHAANREALDSASFASIGVLPGTPLPWMLDFPEGGVVELRLTLRVEGSAGGPRVTRVGLEWGCPGPI